MINSWNLKTGELYVTLKGHIKEITKLALRDKNTLLSSSLDGELRQWNVLNETLDWVITLPGPIRTFILNDAKDLCYAVVDMDVLCVIDLLVNYFYFLIYY